MPVAEAAYRARDQRADGGQVVGVHDVALGGEGVGGIGNVQRGGVDRAVGDQLVELDDSLLVVRVVVADQPSADHQMRSEAVERLRAVGDRGDLVTQIKLGQIAVDGVGLDVGDVGQQRVQQVHRLPHPARDEVGEQRDVVVGHQPERQSPEPAVSDVGLGPQAVFPGVDLRAVGGRGRPVAPHRGDIQLREGVDHVRRRLVILSGVACLFPAV